MKLEFKTRMSDFGDHELSVSAIHSHEKPHGLLKCI